MEPALVGAAPRREIRIIAARTPPRPESRIAAAAGEPDRAQVMAEESGEPIELKHHDDGYLWIDQAHQTVQATAAGHRFVVRDAKHRDRFALEIHLPDWDE